MTTIPQFVSEFPDASVIADCVPASGVMLADKVTHNAIPATIAEREALQAAMGTQDVGADANQLAAGIRKRYTLSLPTSPSWTAIKSALGDPMKGAAIFGEYQKLPAYLRNRGNQPGFSGGHCIYAQGTGVGIAIIGDPLGNLLIPGVPIADLQTFSESFGGMGVIGTEPSAVLVGYRLRIPTAGSYTFFRVVRFTHTLYGAKRVTFSRTSQSPVNHGSPGFWAFPPTHPTLAGYYAVAGKSGVFQIQAVYSDGSTRLVSPTS